MGSTKFGTVDKMKTEHQPVPGISGSVGFLRDVEEVELRTPRARLPRRHRRHVDWRRVDWKKPPKRRRHGRFCLIRVVVKRSLDAFLRCAVSICKVRCQIGWRNCIGPRRNIGRRRSIGPCRIGQRREAHSGAAQRSVGIRVGGGTPTVAYLFEDAN